MGFIGIGNTNSVKKVLCVETGIEFDSVTQAAEVVGCSISNLSNVLKGKRKTTGGFHWEYVNK